MNLCITFHFILLSGFQYISQGSCEGYCDPYGAGYCEDWDAYGTSEEEECYSFNMVIDLDMTKSAMESYRSGGSSCGKGAGGRQGVGPDGSPCWIDDDDEEEEDDDPTEMMADVMAMILEQLQNIWDDDDDDCDCCDCSDCCESCVAGNCAN